MRAENQSVAAFLGAVKSVNEVLPYGGKLQRIKEWERDMGLREAIKMSNVPIYQELARRIEGRVFDYLLTRFTEPNELFGPLR